MNRAPPKVTLGATMREPLQRIINRVARTGQAETHPHQEVDPHGPIDVPATVNVEGDDKVIRVWPDKPDVGSSQVERDA